MVLKLPSIFIIMSLTIIPSLVFASPISDSDIMSQYHNKFQLQDAIDNCKLDYNDLSALMKNYTHAATNCQTINYIPPNANQQNNYNNIIASVSFILSMLFLVASIRKQNRLKRFIKLFMSFMFFGLGIINTSISGMDENGKIGASIIDVSVFFGIGIAMYVRGRQEEQMLLDQSLRCPAKSI